MGKTSFKSKKYHFEEVLELVHTNLCGPTGLESYNGDKYLILFVDDYSRMMKMIYLKDKFESFKKIKWYLDRVEKEERKKLKCLRLDKGGEFMSMEIKMQMSSPSTA